jgi:hypothetical protein
MVVVISENAYLLTITSPLSDGYLPAVEKPKETKSSNASQILTRIINVLSKSKKIT